jgi:GT2 family glycosyltransferase
VARASIIVVSWNGEEHLADCLDALLEQASLDDEVLVVDNASTDGSVELVRSRYPTVRLLEMERNLGFAGGCNVGLRAAAGRRLFLVNQDVTVRPGWLQAMLAALSPPDVGIVGCKLLYPDGTIQHAGGIVSYPSSMTDHAGHLEPDRGQWDRGREVDYVTGAALGLRRIVLYEVGGLDEGFYPGYFEEVDYCFRVRASGRRVVYTPEAVAVHVESTTLGKESQAYLHAYHVGRLRFSLKHLSTEQFLHDFVPSERESLSRVSGQDGRAVMPRVYRAAMLTLPQIYALKEDCSAESSGVFQEMVESLTCLSAEVWSQARPREGGETVSEDPVDELEATGTIHEQPFRSNKPIIGPFIAWFRTVWNSVSTRWYVVPMVEQQNAFNRAVVSHVQEMSGRLIAADRDQTALTRNIAELRYQVIDLDRRLADLEARSRSLEADSTES